MKWRSSPLLGTGVGLYVVFAWTLAAGENAAAERPQRSDPPDLKKINALIERLRPLHKLLGQPQPGDWLLSHPEEGQTFEQYAACDPVVPRWQRKILYIQPLGDFTATQRKIVTLTGDFMSRCFGLQVKTLDDLPLALIPAKAQRVHPAWGVKQILTTYVMDDVLSPRLPKDAAACIAFTASDLWPGEGWNFVFGEASIRERVGVWSISRNGDPDRSAESFRLCLLRTIKLATHETGHMFSMLHCIKYECNMCGCNNREESDRHPLEMCPECVAKLWFATGADPAQRFQKLAEFCKAQGLAAEEAFYEKSAKAAGTTKPVESE